MYTFFIEDSIIKYHDLYKFIYSTTYGNAVKLKKTKKMKKNQIMQLKCAEMELLVAETSKVECSD